MMDAPSFSSLCSPFTPPVAEGGEKGESADEERMEGHNEEVKCLEYRGGRQWGERGEGGGVLTRQKEEKRLGFYGSEHPSSRGSSGGTRDDGGNTADISSQMSRSVFVIK